MAGMGFCARCGGELPATARFCPACGRPVEPVVGPQAPPATRSIWADLRLPGWAGSDWALVGLGVARLLVLLFAASALLGLVAAVAVAGSLKAAPCGAAVGSHLAFAAFGARTAATCGGEHGAALAVGFLPLPWALAGGFATEAALRFAWRRLPEDRARRIAYAGKLALTCGVALGVIAGLVATGDPDRPGSGFASSVNGGEVWFYASVLTWFWAWIGLRRRGLRAVPAMPERLGQVGGHHETGERAGGDGTNSTAGVGGLATLWVLAGEGATVCAVLAGGLAVVGLIVALVVTNGAHDQTGILFGFPVVGFSFGSALVDGAMGAGLGGVRGHTSLAHFGLPAGSQAGAAPVWLFTALVLVPAAVAATVWRRLERERPADEQGALTVGAVTGVGFATAAWLAALVGRIVLLASVGRTGWFTIAPEASPPEVRGAASTLVALRPNPAAVLGLGLLWGLAGGLGAAFLWASRHNARWQITGSAGAAGAPPSPPGPASGASGLPPATAGSEPGRSPWFEPSEPPAAGPSGTEEIGPTSGGRSGEAALSGSGSEPGGPAGDVPSERNVGQEPGPAGDPPTGDVAQEGEGAEEPPEEKP